MDRNADATVDMCRESMKWSDGDSPAGSWHHALFESIFTLIKISGTQMCLMSYGPYTTIILEIEFHNVLILTCCLL